MLINIWKSQALMGILVNVVIAGIILARRYIPVIVARYRVKMMKKGGIKFVAFRQTENMIDTVLVLACVVFIVIPYVFTILVILSMTESRKEEDDE